MRSLRARRTGKSIGVAAALAMAVAVGSIAAGGDKADAKELTKVKLGQVTSTSLTFAPVFAAQDLGFFADEGIELQHLNFQGGAVLQPQIANKQVDIGFTAVELAIIARQPGRDPLPLVFFYNGARGSIWETIVMDSSPIKTMKDLRGKKIGIGATTNANVPLTRAIMHDFGLELGKDYTFVPIGVGAPAYRAMNTGDVDAYNTFDTNIATFQTTGVKVRKLEIPERYTNLFANGFVAHQDTVKDRPEILIGFGRAFSKGLVVCEANPEWCVKNFWKYNPSTKRVGNKSEAEALQDGLTVMKSRLEKYLYFPPGAKREFGVYDEKGWLDYVTILHAGGELSTTSIDVKPLFTNVFVPEYNKFDVKALQDKAKALK